MVGALPATHEGRTDAMCELCHDGVVGGVPSITHDLEGRTDCTLVPHTCVPEIILRKEWLGQETPHKLW